MRIFTRRKLERMTPEEAAAAPTLVTSRYSATALRNLRAQAREQARRARREVALLVPLIAAVLLVYNYRDELPGPNTPVRAACVIALVILGWAFARDIGRAAGPALLRRLEPSTAGTVGFLIRLATLALAILVALRIAGLRPETLAVGGALTAVVLGLAAQQTLGNLFAGLVLISARPFTVGDRLRLQGGGLAGQVEGTVESLGLLHTTLADGSDSILVPNSVVIGVAIMPLREPASVDLRARLRRGVKPSELQSLLEESVQTPVRDRPHIGLEEVDEEEVVVRVQATPLDHDHGPRLADEILSAIGSVTARRPPGEAEQLGGRSAGARPPGEAERPNGRSSGVLR